MPASPQKDTKAQSIERILLDLYFDIGTGMPLPEHAGMLDEANQAIRDAVRECLPGKRTYAPNTNTSTSELFNMGVDHWNAAIDQITESLKSKGLL